MDALKNYRQLRPQLQGELVGFVRLARALPAFLRERVNAERAEQEIKKALETREERFLRIIQQQIYGRASSPYLKLLRIAGCEFSDLQASVIRDGIEATLEKLAREGVYLTSSEFKGKKEVVRGRESFRVSPADFDPPVLSPGVVTHSSGTSNRPIASLASLERLGFWTFMHCLVYSAHDLFSRSHAIYDAILPAGGGVRAVLQHARLGVPTERWFARKVPAEDVVSRYYHLFTTSLIVAMAKIYGAGAAMPEFLDTEEIGRIVCWIAAERKRGRSCCVKAAASGATRIAQAAWQMGVSLEGTKFRVGGEPFTESKRDALKRVGAAAVPDYAFEGGGPVGVGCANPTHLDEMHVQQHIMALIAHPKLLDAGASTVRPLLCTTIHSGYARLLFNVENGDYASFERRDCECLLEKVGLKLHVHHIRSYEKFTSEGMNYFYGDLFEFVETTLPSEFGGGPGDYQLVEEEDDNGRTRITLLVHPAVGELDEEKVMRRFRTRLAEGSSAQRFQAETWRNAGTLRVRRQSPYASPAGKILPLHISR